MFLNFWRTIKNSLHCIVSLWSSFISEKKNILLFSFYAIRHTEDLWKYYVNITKRNGITWTNVTDRIENHGFDFKDLWVQHRKTEHHSQVFVLGFVFAPRSCWYIDPHTVSHTHTNKCTQHLNTGASCQK